MNVEGLVVRNSEIVWYQTYAIQVIRKRDDEHRYEGRLYVCTGRLVFLCAEQPAEISLSHINAVDDLPSAVSITGKSAGHSIEIEAPDNELLAEYIRFAVRAHHRQVDVGFEGNTRRIPQEVKGIVYRRDAGKCVECGAEDYLEFDHVIPFSRGGANTAENLQLLCRRCNLKKSDRV